MDDKSEIPTGETTSVVGQTGQSAQGAADACQDSIVRWDILDIYSVVLVIKLITDLLSMDEGILHVVGKHSECLAWCA